MKPLHTQDPWTIVHDFAFNYGGAERVTEVVAHDVLTQAQVLFLGAEDAVVERMGLSQRAGFILPRSIITAATYRRLAPLYAPALYFRRPVEGSVFASSYAFAHFQRASGRQIVYCHSPLRQIWSGYAAYRQAGTIGGLGALAIPLLRSLDRRAAVRATSYLSTGSPVHERVLSYYGLDSLVLPPPVDDEAFQFDPSVPRGAHFLWVGRLVEPYKGLEALLEAFREMPNEQLSVAGEGRDGARLRSVAPINVRFLGPLDTASLAQEYQRAQAVIFSSVDDFGLVPVESMLCGTPVIAIRGGGALETMVDGTTGILVDNLSRSALVAAIRQVRTRAWDGSTLARHGRRFGKAPFVSQLTRMLDAANI